MRAPSWVVGPVVLAISATSGCSVGGSPEREALPLPTWDGPSSDAVRLLSLEGTLTLDDEGCVRLDTDPTAGVVTPIWPDGFAAARDGAAVVLEPAGDHAGAEVGQRVRLAGGYSSARYEDVACGEHEGAPAFEVDQVITAP